MRDKDNYTIGKLGDYLSRITFIEIDGTDPAFPSISYKSNCFKLLSQGSYLNLDDDSKVVITDCDVLWHEDPDQTLDYLSNFDLWAQITTPLNLLQYSPFHIPLSRFDCGYRTLWDAKRHGVHFREYSPYRINAGLFMISWKVFKESFVEFIDCMRQIPVRQIRLSESILSNILFSKGLVAHSFVEDVFIKLRLPILGKYSFDAFSAKSNFFLREYFQFNFDKQLVLLDKSQTKGLLSGRQIATHYICPDQKDAMIRDAKIAGIEI